MWRSRQSDTARWQPGEIVELQAGCCWLVRARNGAEYTVPMSKPWWIRPATAAVAKAADAALARLPGMAKCPPAQGRPSSTPPKALVTLLVRCTMEAAPTTAAPGVKVEIRSLQVGKARLYNPYNDLIDARLDLGKNGAIGSGTTRVYPVRANFRRIVYSRTMTTYADYPAGTSSAGGIRSTSGPAAVRAGARSAARDYSRAVEKGGRRAAATAAPRRLRGPWHDAGW